MVKINLKVDTDKKDLESTMISKNIVNNACYTTVMVLTCQRTLLTHELSKFHTRF